MKLYISLLIVPLVITGFATKAQSTYDHKKRNEKWALAKIKALPEVKAFMRKAKKSKPLVIVAGDPDAMGKYYWVKIGVSNFGIFRTTDDFLIDPKTSQIYFYDIALEIETGDYIATLKQWRRWRSDARFWKPHTFKDGKLVTLVK